VNIFKVKITVLKKLDTGSLRRNYGGDLGECPFRVNDEFVSEELGMPEGFCPWAWADIQRDVAHLALGGDFPWMKIEGTGISCCTDGLRPVVFKLKRIK